MASPASASALLAALRAPRLDVYPLPALMEAAEVVPWGAEPVRDAFPLASHRRTSPSGSEDEANLKRRGSVSSASKAGVAGRGRDASPSSGEAKESKAGEGVCVEDWFPPGFAALLRRILTCEPGHRPTVSQAMAEFDDLFQPMIVALRRALARERGEKSALAARLATCERERDALLALVRAQLPPSPPTASSVVVDTPAALLSFLSAIAHVETVSFDCEGVHLSRAGSVTLVTLGVPTYSGEVSIYHFDLLSEFPGALEALTGVLEDASVVKLIHDVRMDADALLAQCGIAVTNVIDTQVVALVCATLDAAPSLEVGSDVWISEVFACDRPNLNTTLRRFGIRENDVRGSIDYNAEPAYWAKRPLTPDMCVYAAGDVAMLHELWAAEVLALGPHGIPRPLLAQLCLRSMDSVRACAYHQLVPVPQHKFGRVIGKAGSTLRALEREHGVVVTRGPTGNFLVLAAEEAALRSGVAAIHTLAAAHF